MRAAIVLAAIGTLAGCGNSPSGQAQQDATSASYGASKLLVYAGDYRPSSSLLQKTTSPLSADQFDQLKEQADGSQAATFLAPRPAGTDLVETDLLAAQSLLSTAASNPDLADQLKSVINAQQALVGLAQVDRIIYQMQSALDAARNQTVNLSVLSLQLANYRSQITMLQQEQQAYAQANELDLADAQQKAVQAQQAVDAAAQKLDALKTQMTYNQQKAADYNSEGMILRNESQNITGQGSLDAFRQGGDEFNTAAAYSQKAQVLESQVDIASQELSILNLNKQAADASVQAISNERTAAVQIAQQDANQIVVLQTQARSLILGAAESDALSGAQSIQQGATGLQAQLDALNKQAQDAATLCLSAQSSLSQALNEVRSNYTISDDLTAHGVPGEDPMVLVTGNHKPEALLQLLLAAVYFRSAQINYILMQAAQLQLSTSSTLAPVYAMVDQSSPVTAPESDSIENFRTKVLNDLGQQTALGAVEQTRMGYAPGEPPLDWLTPLMQFQIDLFAARVATNPNTRAAAIQDAAKAASEANRYNSSLNLQLPQDLIGS